MKKGYLALADGRVFEGERFGADGDALGELVFTTGMTGYLETLTDPSYFGQIIVQTFPLIGNYGVIPEDFESGGVFARGYVVREMCATPSNFRAKGTLDDFLRRRGIPALCGVDTRAVTAVIRESGTMNARICDSAQGVDAALLTYSVQNALVAVSRKAPETLPAHGEKKRRVALMDFGAKRGVAEGLRARGCEVVLLPHDTAADAVLALRPDGVMLSNGPGDPAACAGEIATVRKLLGNVPIMGICLGHQLLALAAGAATAKLKYGHRGANQPALRVADGRVFITSQNHGYAVVADTLPKDAQESFRNANDGTNEGVDYPARRAFSVQFHPEACAGPLDAAFLFDRFISLMDA